MYSDLLQHEQINVLFTNVAYHLAKIIAFFDKNVALPIMYKSILVNFFVIVKKKRLRRLLIDRIYSASN